MRDQRHRAYAQYLRQRIDEKAGIAGRAHACDRRITQVGDEIQIDQLAEHDHDQPCEDLRRPGGEMAHDRALGEVFHIGSSGHAKAWTGSVGWRARARDRLRASVKNSGDWKLMMIGTSGPMDADGGGPQRARRTSSMSIGRQGAICELIEFMQNPPRSERRRAACKHITGFLQVGGCASDAVLQQMWFYSRCLAIS